jgi:small subunit ribosomal protein S9
LKLKTFFCLLQIRTFLFQDRTVQVPAPAPIVTTSGDYSQYGLEKGKYVFATGRRKSSVSNVRLIAGSGKHMVNKKEIEKFFFFAPYMDDVLRPFAITGLGGIFQIVATVNGGGSKSQAGATQHALAKALAQLSPAIRSVMKKAGYLSRDSREKERKKPGLKRARRRPQWAKR